MRLILLLHLIILIDFVQNTNNGNCTSPSTQRENEGRFENESSLLSCYNQDYPAQDSRSLAFNSLIPAIIEDFAGRLIAEVAWKILDTSVRGCRVFIITQDSRKFLVSYIIRYSTISSIPFVVYETSPSGQETIGRNNPWRSDPGNCQVFILDLTSGDISQLFRILLDFRFWLLPEARIFLVGRNRAARSVLRMSAFRSSLHILYLGFDDVTLQENGIMTIYSRCLVCNNEPEEIQILASWNLLSGESKVFEPFPYKLQNFHGNLLKATSTIGPYFPYIDFQMSVKDLSETVTLTDSLAKRLTDTLSSAFNFTYEVFVPPDDGLSIPAENGSWSGMVGALQQGKADLSLIMTTSDIRLPVMDLSRTCESDPLIIVSLKSQPLPQYLAIVRPFTVNVWLYLVASIMIWGLSLWILEKLRSKFTGESSMTLYSSIFYSWAVILDDPPLKPPKNSTGKMLVGWWLIAALVFSTGFRSSLVANLSVPSKTKPINSYEDLLDQNNMHWGIHDLLLRGQTRHYFINSNDQVVKKIYENTELIDLEKGFAKVVSHQGKYAIIGSKTRVRTAIAQANMDEFHRRLLHISRQSYKAVTDFGCGFRKGSPYYNFFLNAINRLIDAGLINYWMEDIIASRVRQIRRENTLTGTGRIMENQDIDRVFGTDEIVLGTRHMIGIYLLVLGGYAIAFLAFLAEKIVYKHYDAK